MQQLTQQLKSGKMEIIEVPVPALGKDQVLVRNYYSIISAGTEGKTVTDARKGYITKARSRQKEVQQVIELIKTQGLRETYNMVMNKLEAPSPLGYSCAGEVIATGENITSFAVGDKVACGGNTAVHADIVAVPVNLCVKVPDNVDLKQAAMTTIASIAVQGIRQAELKMGESCLVIGTGIIGILTMQMLEAAGIKAIGVDVNKTQIEYAKKLGVQNIYDRNAEGIEDLIKNFSGRSGTDAVIITAAASSTDPVELAGEAAGKKGKVVIVGAVPTGFSRKNYYRKELDLRMSCSYGPGRYDPLYEEKGIDYPEGYVRWTENRNMQFFIDLLSRKKINIDPLISHTFPLIEAPNAYNIILEKSEPFAGIAIQYDSDSKSESTIRLRKEHYQTAKPVIGFIGAGSFAQNMLLPNLKNKIQFSGVVTARGNTSRYIADKYGFSYCTSDGNEVIQDKNTNTVFIATRHDLHGKYVLEALQAGKNVFVEKPLALKPDELEKIKGTYYSMDKENRPRVMVGFNRRFAPAVRRMNTIFNQHQQKAISMRINAGIIPADHWVHDPETGGGRIIGEVCHFIDLATFIAGSKVNNLFATVMKDPENKNDTLTINLHFNNGSICSIAYFSNGNKKLPKEYIEIFCGGSVIQINDFKEKKIIGKINKSTKQKSQDKGHKEELIRFIHAIEKGESSPIPFDELYHSSLVTFRVIDSIKSGQAIAI